MSSRTLGSFLLSTGDSGYSDRGRRFQCPLGLWGLFYRRSSSRRPGVCQRFQCPLGLWGLFYVYLDLCTRTFVTGFSVLSDSGVFSTFWQGEWDADDPASFSVLSDSGVFSTRLVQTVWVPLSTSVSVSSRTLGSFLRYIQRRWCLTVCNGFSVLSDSGVFSTNL